MYRFFFFNDTATTEIYTLSLHDALPISLHDARRFRFAVADFRADNNSAALATVPFSRSVSALVRKVYRTCEQRVRAFRTLGAAKADMGGARRANYSWRGYFLLYETSIRLFARYGRRRICARLHHTAGNFADYDGHNRSQILRTHFQTAGAGRVFAPHRRGDGLVRNAAE